MRSAIGRKFKGKIRISSVVLYALFFFIMAAVITFKEGYSEKELQSYGLANQQELSVIAFDDGKTYVPASEAYAEYLTVDEEHRFDYANVWERQAEDLHPPLYYLILHTICSLFPGVFSRWFAGIINIAFALLTLYILRKLIRLLTDDRKILTVLSFAFVFSSGIISAVTLFRMYILAMFFVTLLTYMVIKASSARSLGLKFFLNLFAVTALGALTHYYCLVYAFFIYIVFLAVMLVRKNWLASVKLAASGLLAAAAAYIVFPSMLSQMASAWGQVESFYSSGYLLHELFVRIRGFFYILNHQMFGGLLIYIAAGLALTFVIYLIYDIRKYEAKPKTAEKLLLALDKDAAAAKENLVRYILIFVPVILYCLFAARAAATVSDQYITPIYAVAFAGTLCLVITLFRNIFSEKSIYPAAIVLLSVILVNSWNGIGWPYLYRTSLAFLNETSSYGDSDCLYVYSERYQTLPSFREVSAYKSVTFLDEENFFMLPTLDIALNDRLIVKVTDNDQAILNEVIATYPHLNSCYAIGSDKYSTTYYVYSGF